jgi:hypothetical protein
VGRSQYYNYRIPAGKSAFSPGFPLGFGDSCTLSCKALNTAEFPGSPVCSYFALYIATSNLLVVAVVYVLVQVLCDICSVLPLSAVHLASSNKFLCASVSQRVSF